MNGSKTAAKLAMLSAVVMTACVSMTSARAVTIDWVTVGDAGNVADTTGYGSVADSFQIMKYALTNQQYVEFLNAVDPSGSNPFSIYNGSMGSSARAGISFTSGNAAGSKYASRANMADKPVNFVSWFDAARVANWLQNGQGSGSTETGAYTLVGGQTSGTAPARNPGATYYIPTEDQWYKAAYYKGGNTNAGYWAYATQSNETPTPVASDSTGIGLAGSTGNFANYNYGADWNGAYGNVTTVGTSGGPSAYGVFDMNGNVQAWNDLTGLTPGSSRGLRGGGWGNNATILSSSISLMYGPSLEQDDVGIRLASPVAPVPEPSTYAMALAGIACGGFSVWRRRKRA